MADDEEELDGEVEDEDAIGDDDLDDDFEEEFEGDPEFVADDDDEDEDTSTSGTTAKSGDDEDDEEPDPDDVEEDLDVILKDRLASGDDLDEEEDDEDEVVAPPITATEGDNVAPKRDGEWTCTGCFLIVSARQFGKKETATCPSGVSDCPSLEML